MATSDAGLVRSVTVDGLPVEAAVGAEAALGAVLAAQLAIIGKLRSIAVGLQQDLTLALPGDGRPVPAEGSLSLGVAVEASFARIASEEAVLAKLQRLRRGLIVDLGCGVGGEGNADGGDSGSV